MEAILVPTDFSDNSKPGLRFAIRLAARNKAPLVFVHIFQPKRPYLGDADALRKEHTDKAQSKLEAFIRKVYNSLKVEPGQYSCEVLEGFKADISLLDYCQNHPDIKLIIISTRGGSFVNKILGTNTGNLITKSPIPVIAIPKDYRNKPLHNVLYATDLENLDQEFQRVLDFAKPRGLSIELLHFSSPLTQDLEKALKKEELESKAGYPLNIRIVKNDITHPMSKNLQQQIEKIKPSLVILFTNQKRSFYERLFLSSMSEGLSFKSQTPLLVFKK
ncbi:universal stress protein [Albibacterium bauzanense]|uniref:Nucleotide-binding universal stress UspA family protein n=1 Tax=Albibacterium bauzanense TaxID=653929 RepID=A0A4R1LZ45_9SPHI|nr:universal stress protein [Albibacterium bauzanense]TCK84856.1 nucleotide-binding universal stress UspA family protein [Albibacterium bauzanense]